MVLLCSWYGLGYGLDMFRYGFGMFWMWFWYGVDMVWERSAFFRVPDGLASRKETETAPRQVFGRSTILIRLWYDFDTILIRFWYGFDTILIRLWYDFDMVLIRFWIWFRWVGFKSKFWPTSRVITETISKSYLKPYQHHNCKTTPETIHTNKSYLKRIKIIKEIFWKTFILETSDVIRIATIPVGVNHQVEWCWICRSYL